MSTDVHGRYLAVMNSRIMGPLDVMNIRVEKSQAVTNLGMKRAAHVKDLHLALTVVNRLPGLK